MAATDDVTEALTRLEAEEATGDSAALDAFWAALSRLGEIDEAARARLVGATAARVLEGAAHISRYIEGIETTLFDHEWHGGEWESVCRRRTALEWFFDAYRDHIPSDYMQVWFDTEQVDEALRERGEHEGPAPDAEVPEGTPATHWWWWYPGAPPG